MPFAHHLRILYPSVSLGNKNEVHKISLNLSQDYTQSCLNTLLCIDLIFLDKTLLILQIRRLCNLNKLSIASYSNSFKNNLILIFVKLIYKIRVSPCEWVSSVLHAFTVNIVHIQYLYLNILPVRHIYT